MEDPCNARLAAVVDQCGRGDGIATENADESIATDRGRQRSDSGKAHRASMAKRPSVARISVRVRCSSTR